MNAVKRFFSWYGSTLRKQKLVGKIVILTISFTILCCIGSVPIAILNPSTATPQADTNPTTRDIAATSKAYLETPTAEVPTETPTPSITLEPIEQLKYDVAEVLGESNRDVPRLSNFRLSADGSDLEVYFSAQDILTKDMTIFGIKKDIVDILQTIHQSNTPIQYEYVVVIATLPLVDVYGNSNEREVVIATYSRETLDKVNWEKFLTDNVYKIALQENLFIHQAIQEE